MTLSMILVRLALMACFFLVLPAKAADIVRITGARIGGTAEETRFVLDVAEQVNFSAAMEGDVRVVLTLRRAVLEKGTEEALAGVKNKLLIAGVTRRDAGDVTQIVLALTRPTRIAQFFSIPARDGKPPRLVVDLALVETVVTETTTETVVTGDHAAVAKTEKKTEIVKVQKAPPKADKKPARLIVIDPGHGGVDPGAVSAGGAKEKDITLEAARALQKELRKNPGYKVILTRDRDLFIPLKERRDIARRQQADLFISLHADIAGSGDDVRGASIYTISDEASDAESAKLAARENLSDTIAGIDIGQQDDAEVAGILIDLAMRETMNQSKRFAHELSGHFSRSKVRQLDKPLRAAGFAVLKAPDVPSVLIEMGFLSSKDETAQLQTPQHRAKLAKAIAGGVDQYFAYLARQSD